MKRQMKASAVVLLISGCLLTLSAGAAPKEQAKGAARSAGQCAFECTGTADRSVAACMQSCPPASASGKNEASNKCHLKCSEKLHAALEACKSSCPKDTPATPAQEPDKSQAPAPPKKP